MTLQELQEVRNALEALDNHARFSAYCEEMRNGSEHALKLLDEEITNMIELEQKKAA